MKMQGLIHKAILNEQEYMQNQRADWAFTKKVMRQILEDLLPQGASIYCSYSSITIRVPWGVDNIRQARKAMGSGWRFSSNYTDNNGTLTKSYIRTDDSLPADSYQRRCTVWLNLIMDASELDPNTCKRIEVGEKTYTQKVYQVICEDGVKEVLGKAEELEMDK